MNKRLKRLNALGRRRDLETADLALAVCLITVALCTILALTFIEMAGI